jgi:hypothetical protein
MSSCGGKDHRVSFRSFCRTLQSKDFPVLPVDESRFIHLEQAITTVYCNFSLFFLYQLYWWNQLSVGKRKLFAALCDLDVLYLIRLRAIGASLILRPIMAKATGFQEGKSLAEFFTNTIVFLNQSDLDTRFDSFSSLDVQGATVSVVYSANYV